jgi:hypothetical protein
VKRVDRLDRSTGRVPNGLVATSGEGDVIPALHTPYDYDERFKR